MKLLKMASEKELKYIELTKSIEHLIDKNCSWIANYANVCAAIQAKFNFWWCGFYLINQNKKLELGPFQGPVACTLIDYGKGVCGSAWKEEQSIIVPNVHEFEGHIACSSESNSEIVIPIFKNNEIIGVLDVDSKDYNCFDEIDQKYLEQICKLL